MKRSRNAVLILVCGSGLMLGGASPALGHNQTVTPPGHDEPVVSGPISNSWARAHCESNAPAVVSTASGGVVSFTPANALCLEQVNPGGQIHP